MGGSSCGNFDAFAWGSHGHWLGWGSTGTNVPSARASVTALGGLQLGTNELIGEDPSVVIRLVPAS